jgi:hypothetical protein
VGVKGRDGGLLDLNDDDVYLINYKPRMLKRLKAYTYIKIYERNHKTSVIKLLLDLNNDDVYLINYKLRLLKYLSSIQISQKEDFIIKKDIMRKIKINKC